MHIYLVNMCVLVICWCWLAGHVCTSADSLHAKSRASALENPLAFHSIFILYFHNKQTNKQTHEYHRRIFEVLHWQIPISQMKPSIIMLLFYTISKIKKSEKYIYFWISNLTDIYIVESLIVMKQLPYIVMAGHRSFGSAGKVYLKF